MEVNEVLMRLPQSLWLLVFACLGSLDITRAFMEVGRAPIIQVESGELEGRRIIMSNSRLVPVYQYLGVPYATPPVGPRRFRPPHTPVPSWEGIRNATTFGPACPQKIPELTADTPLWRSRPLKAKRPFLSNMSEDCLYLNIYVPERGRENMHIFLVMTI
ncbi:neuroligin-2-like [Diadema antillarum]|uniref:neuroligin-2-like n=1 Tax=Diadema antillarum TaxID=105358 RepID=UPI003A85CAE0